MKQKIEAMLKDVEVIPVKLNDSILQPIVDMVRKSDVEKFLTSLLAEDEGDVKRYSDEHILRLMQTDFRQSVSTMPTLDKYMYIKGFRKHEKIASQPQKGEGV